MTPGKKLTFLVDQEMGTRTSIRIGSLLDNSMKLRFPGYERVLEEYTNQFLLFCYRKKIHQHYYSSVLFQASKTFGGLTCEVAISRTEDFPYYRFFDQPSLGIHGFRARTLHLLKGTEVTTTRQYTGPDSLMGVIIDLVGEALSSSKKLTEDGIPRIAEQYALWQPIYDDWVEAEKNASDNPDRRYKGLLGEAAARRILHRCLRQGKFDSFLGPNKFKYRQPEFLNCHVYLLARALAFVDPPYPDEFQALTLDPSQDPEKIVFDGISALNGRLAQDEAVEPSSRMLDRYPEWAFLRSFAALEAFFEQETVDLSQVKTTIKEPIKKEEPAPPPEPALSLDELYSDAPPLAPLEGSFEGSALEPEPEQKKASRPDPFESFEAYISGEMPAVEEEEKEESVDPFDVLGSQLGL